MSVESRVGRAFLDAIDMLKAQLASTTVEYLRENTPEMSIEQVKELIVQLEATTDTAANNAVTSVIKATKE